MLSTDNNSENKDLMSIAKCNTFKQLHNTSFIHRNQIFALLAFPHNRGNVPMS